MVIHEIEFLKFTNFTSTTNQISFESYTRLDNSVGKRSIQISRIKNRKGPSILFLEGAQVLTNFKYLTFQCYGHTCEIINKCENSTENIFICSLILEKFELTINMFSIVRNTLNSTSCHHYRTPLSQMCRNSLHRQKVF